MSTPFFRSLAEIVGATHCLHGADRAPYVIDGRTPCGVVFPGSADEVARVVQAAAAAQVPVVPWGGGTQVHRGAPPRDGALVVGLRRLDQVLEHEPGDLTATAEAGITLAALQGALGARGQWLPLDPAAPGEATLGGVLAANTAGPRRQGYGTARDHVIGIRVVAADGQLVRAGGKVVKNVAGYDLAKLYIGSRGTLGIIVDATLKLRPQPEAVGACWATFPGLEPAAGAAAALAASELEPAALTLLDARAAEACGRHAGLAVDGPTVLVLFEGLAAAVAWERDAAAGRLRTAGARHVAVLDGAAAERALDAVREARRLVARPVAVATVGVLPADLGAYLVAAGAAAAGSAGVGLAAVAHAGHGAITLILVAVAPAPPPAATTAAVLARCRDAARSRGGHLVVDWAPVGVREICPVWDPPGPATGIMRELKARLDPGNLLNPGRFVAGI